ncbi:MAG: L,D-transpeptidase family protein, partial [Bdellovibrio sp.]|nr:L,D-transpeptidase family protein [Bdellovibrio sp.]
MEIFRRTTLSLLLVLLSSSSYAQFQSSAKPPKPPPEEKIDYNMLLSQLDLPQMRQAFLSVWKHGLNPNAYWNEKMEALFSSGGSNDRNLRPLANQAFLRLLRDIQIGTVDPATVTRDIKLTRKEFLTPKQLQAVMVAVGHDSVALMNRVAPQNAPYVAVREGMQKIYPACVNGQWTNINPVNSPLRIYSRNPVIVDIKKRIALLGYKMDNFDDTFDSDLFNAVVDIQWNLRIKPDGEISPKGKIWGFLNISCMDRVRQLQVDMEKMRWFPQYWENRYIFVNLAMNYFILMDNSTQWQRIMTFRTVNGRPTRKSPTMRDEVVKVIVNPFWIVPPTIFYEDKVNDLKGLSRDDIKKYFDSHHYEVWNGNFTKKLDPTAVDWSGISKGGPEPDLNIRQLPHLGNALGVVKFDLTNSFAIYMHDTN